MAFYFGTGTAVASNVTLILRALKLKSTTLEEVLAPIGRFSWREGTESPWQTLRDRLARRRSRDCRGARRGREPAVGLSWDIGADWARRDPTWCCLPDLRRTCRGWIKLLSSLWHADKKVAGILQGQIVLHRWKEE
jgi:hypothetical protein